MQQLSVKHELIDLRPDMLMPNTYGKNEQAAMAALLITMCKEHGNVWQGFTREDILHRVAKELWNVGTGKGGAFLFSSSRQGVDNYLVGLPELIERGMLQVEPDEDNSSFDVVFPTEMLLEPIQRLIRA
jgi:hypothetical protein